MLGYLPIDLFTCALENINLEYIRILPLFLKVFHKLLKRDYKGKVIKKIHCDHIKLIDH